MAERNELQSRRRNANTATITMAICMTFAVTYPVSLGPVNWALHFSGMSASNEGPLMRGLSSFYAPAAFVLKTDSPVRQPYSAYVKLWGPRVLPPLTIGEFLREPRP